MALHRHPTSRALFYVIWYHHQLFNHRKRFVTYTHTHTHKALLHNPAHYPIVAFVRSLSLRPTEHRRRCILLTVVNRRRRSVLCRSSCTIVWGQLCILLKKERKRIKPKTRGNDVSIGEKSGSAVARARARCQQIRVANFSSLVLRRDGLARA